MKPNWTPKLKDVLKHTTKEITLISSRTGKEYKVEAIEKIVLLSNGFVENTTDGKFKYSIVDPDAKLDYEIKVANEVPVKFGTKLVFKNLRGGLIPNSNYGWYAADSVELYVKNV